MEDLDLTIEAWLDKFDEGKLPKGNDERIEAFMILLKTLKDRGTQRNELSLVRSKVIIRCTNPNHNGQKLKIWKNILEQLFNKAVVRIWTEEFSALTDEEKNPTKIKLTPQAPKPDIIEEEPEEVPRYGKELDRSIFDKDPSPDVQVDKELSEMLGFDSDE